MASLDDIQTSVDGLPVDIDSTYPDRSPGDAAHQQHHDIAHQALRDLPGAVDNATSGPLVLRLTAAAALPASASHLTGRIPGMSHSASSTTQSVTDLSAVPDSWATFDVYLLHGHDSSSPTGTNGVWTLLSGEIQDGERVDNSETTLVSDLAVEAGTSFRINRDLLIAGVSTSDAHFRTFRLRREGGNASDDFSAAIVAVGIQLVKAS